MPVWVDSIQGGQGHVGVWTQSKVGMVVSVWVDSIQVW